MTDLPTPKRRAELRAMAAKYAGGILLSEEIIALLDATTAAIEDAEAAAFRRGWLAGRLASTLAIAALPPPEDKP